ncbi:MAG: protein phosphatase 2C domain-containing protein [Gammaproteobacteria bacterium]|nr:protein phosphatase 2C domain-containing protein [Gammaproteobacteria bacterium]MDH5802426.1 protein phosphatase 2C domain-containing protein [Gammaproteobacteria bacterium]
MADSPLLRWTSCSSTHVGHVRQINEDSFLDRADIKLWAIADGMGGHHAGDVASNSIVSELDAITPRTRLSTYIDEIEDRLITVNRQLRDLAAQHKDNRTIGSTVMAMVALDDHYALLWAGDSRAYLSRNGHVSRLTRDHSQVEELVERGVILPEDAESHPAANIITRAVGASDQLFVDVDVDEAQPGDKFLLCSDGLYKHIADDELVELLQNNDLEDICKSLIETTLARGATDNVTVVVVSAEAANADEVQETELPETDADLERTVDLEADVVAEEISEIAAKEAENDTSNVDAEAITKSAESEAEVESDSEKPEPADNDNEEKPSR